MGAIAGTVVLEVVQVVNIWGNGNEVQRGYHREATSSLPPTTGMSGMRYVYNHRPNLTWTKRRI